MSLHSLLNGVQTLAIVCNQWGDSGKGKFIDYFAEDWADMIVRGSGANNAGHTVVIADNQYIFHLIPSGILHDKDGKINVIGNGVLINPAVLLNELSVLDSEKKTYNGLRISNEATLITPDDLLVEYFKEKSRKKRKIGTTMRGVGPGYASKMARDTVKVYHLFNKDEFVKKYREKFLLNFYIINSVFGASHSDMCEIMESSKFKANGKFGVDRPDPNNIVTEYMEYADKIKDFVTNTQLLIDEYRRNGKKILLEGAQGLLLSIDHGTYPYVTSSDCSASGLSSGAGISPADVDLVLGIAKMFYMTRVGGGPFPTEFVDESVVKASLPSEKELQSMQKTPKQWEAENYNKVTTLFEIAQGNEESLSRYCRVKGAEYGATTGRPRRTGWLDLVALRYAVAINGPNVISTKTDVLDDLEEIKLCDSYKYTGPTTFLSSENRYVKDGDEIRNFPQESWILDNVVPIYFEMDGWKCDTSGITDYKQLPENKKKIFREIIKRTGINLRVISVGAERNQTIIK